MRKRKDLNHQEIVKAYKWHGFSVADTADAGDGFPDLVVGKFGRTYLVEVKQGKGKLRETQKDFKQNWRGCYRVVRSVDDVILHAKAAIKQ